MNEARKNDLEAYRFNPLFRGNLKGKVYLKSQLGKRDVYFGLKEKLKGLEFEDIGAIDTNKGNWKIYGRFNHQIPEFPEGGDRYDSALGLYYGNEMPDVCQQMVLQHSLDTINRARFGDILKNTADYYLERPLISGLTSKVTTVHPLFIVGGGVLLGAIIGGQVIPYEQISNDTLTSAIFPSMKGIIIGGYGSMALSLPLNFAGELNARLHIKDKSELIVGKVARDVLNLEYSHLFEVLNQREIYQALEQPTKSGVKINLGATDFLYRVYNQLPIDLRRVRIMELESQRGLRVGRAVSSMRNVLPRLIDSAKIIIDDDLTSSPLEAATQAG